MRQAHRRIVSACAAIAAAGCLLAGSAAHAQTNPIPQGPRRIELDLIGTFPTGSGASIDLTHAGDNSGRLFVAGQGASGAARVSIFRNGAFQPTPFLTLNTASVGNAITVGGETGLLGMAFHPGFAAPAGTPGRGKFYTYTSEPVTATPDFSHPEISPTVPGVAANHQSVIREWTVSTSNPDVIDTSAGAASSRVVVRINQPQSNHNGGAIKFDAGGRLYVALGDGGGSNDHGGTETTPNDGHTNTIGNAQDRSNVYGKILRIDPAGASGTLSANGQYRIPTDNPFANDAPTANTLAEIYAYGLRNPFRMSFDRLDGSLRAGDVGQGEREEVDRITSGGNYGWVYREGTRLNRAGEPAGLIAPIGEYTQADGRSVIGGFVYRGSVPELYGQYVFGDAFGNGTGRLFYMDPNGGPIREFLYAGDPLAGNLYSFGEDQAGELYVVTAGRSIYRVVPEPAALPLLAAGGVALAGRARRGLRA